MDGGLGGSGQGFGGDLAKIFEEQRVIKLAWNVGRIGE
jgi:hypothetical protein